MLQRAFAAAVITAACVAIPAAAHAATPLSPSGLTVDRLTNPLGFQVTRYRRDAETLPETLPQAGPEPLRTARPSPVAGAEAPVTLRRVPAPSPAAAARSPEPEL